MAAIRLGSRRAVPGLSPERDCGLGCCEEERVCGSNGAYVFPACCGDDATWRGTNSEAVCAE
jgi:hypothetical protein